MSAAPWMQTHSGVAFDLLAPRVEDVVVGDISVSIARIARYLGHTLTGTGYSVAQHSVLCADLIRTWGGDAALEREALLHDAAEAYYGDITSPVQRALRDLHRARVDAAMHSGAAELGRQLMAEGSSSSPSGEMVLRAVEFVLRAGDPLSDLKARIDPVVRKALGLAEQEPALVKRADLVAIAIERKLLMGSCDRDWEIPELADTRWSQIRAEYDASAHESFLARLHELDERIARGGGR